MPSVRATAAAAESLQRLYGARVAVRYHDLADRAVQERHADLLEHLRAEGYPLPVTFLDGEILFAGGLQPLKLVAAVAARLQRQGPLPDPAPPA
jgi:hypothetical protein